jgi:hypothetical protein
MDWVMELFPPKTLELILSKTLGVLPTEQGIKDMGICRDLIFTQYSQIPSNTLGKTLIEQGLTYTHILL